MNLGGANLDSAVDFSYNLIDVNSVMLPVLNRRANLTFRGVSYDSIEEFDVLKNDVVCEYPACIKHSSDPVIVEVAGFSTYTTVPKVEEYLPSEVCSGLIGYWTFDDDDHGNSRLFDVYSSNYGTIYGATAGHAGKVGESFYFNGQNDYIDLGKKSAYNNLAGGLTVAGWIRPFDDGSSYCKSIVSKRLRTTGNTGRGFNLCYYPYRSVNDIRLQLNTMQLATGPVISHNAWTFIVATYNNNQMRIYQDGSLVAQGSYPSTILSSSDPLQIGGRSDSPHNFFRGHIDELAVYSRSLSPSEINDLYLLSNAGNRYCTEQVDNYGNQSEIQTYHSYGSGNVPFNTSVTIYASYLDINGNHIPGASCTIEFNDSGISIPMPESEGRHSADHAFDTTGLHQYHAVCSKEGKDEAERFGTIRAAIVLDQYNTYPGSWEVFTPGSYNIARIRYDDSGIYMFGTIKNGTEYDYFMKHNTLNGTQVWEDHYDYSNIDLGRDMAITLDNHLVGTGDCISTDISICTVKYDRSGALLWNQTLMVDGGNSFARQVTSDILGNIYISGSFFNFTEGDYDAMLARYGSDGDLHYYIIYHNPKNQTGGGIVVDASGNAYMATLEGDGDEKEICLSKMNEFGSIENRLCFPVDGDLADVGDLVIVPPPVDSPPGTPPSIYMSYNTGDDLVVHKLQSDGPTIDRVWTSTYSTGSPTSSSTLSVDDSGNVYLSGTSAPKSDVSGEYYSSFVKLSPDGSNIYQSSSPISSYSGNDISPPKVFTGVLPSGSLIKTDNGVMSTYIERELPKISQFDTGIDFFNLPDIYNVPSVWLSTDFGGIEYEGNITLAGQDIDSAVVIGPCFISVNTSALDPSWNSESILTLDGSHGCNGTAVFTTPNFHTDFESAMNDPLSDVCIDCKNPRRQGRFVMFDVIHFTTYFIGSNADLAIYEEYSGSYPNINQPISFYANYTNKTGYHLSGADCFIGFDDMPGMQFEMSDTGFNYLYNRTSGFSVPGEYIWNVTCNMSIYEEISGNTTIHIGLTGDEIPEFSTIAIMIALLLVAIGVISSRKRNL